MKDKKILLYAGTTEGRKLASYLGRRGVRLHVCVATAYGESLLPEEKNITVTHDRMDSGQMCDRCNASICQRSDQKLEKCLRGYAGSVFKTGQGK